MLSQLHKVDAEAYLWLRARKRRDQIAETALWISKTGDGPLYAVLAVLIAISGGSEGRLFFACALLAYAMDVPLYMILKNRIKRVRPFKRLSVPTHIAPADEFSFPSGHTAAAFLWASLIAAFYPTLTIAAFIWALGVGTSRVLLGVHYPGDILAGMVLGSGCAAIALLILV